MTIIHITSERNEANGMCRVAKDLAEEQCRRGDEAVVMTAQEFLAGDSAAREVWVHGMWLPCEWKAMRKALGRGGSTQLVRMPHGSLSPVYLRHQGRWKKALVGPVERYFFRRASRIVATCEEEAAWIRQYLNGRPNIEITDLRRFFKLDAPVVWPKADRGLAPLHVLYLGREHPLKGVRYLRQAVAGLNEGGVEVELAVVSDVFGEELARKWHWCDVLCLPTLSENFGRVVGEAIAHGRPVITTDGAPAWRRHFEEHPEHGRYLRGFVAGTDERRVALLRQALEDFVDRLRKPQ